MHLVIDFKGIVSVIMKFCLACSLISCCVSIKSSSFVPSFSYLAEVIF